MTIINAEINLLARKFRYYDQFSNNKYCPDSKSLSSTGGKNTVMNAIRDR